jgi:hypothetical protein
MEIKKLKEFIQSANINFLFGSGLSQPYLSTIGNIEQFLTKHSELPENMSENTKHILKASIYREYFIKVMLPNLEEEKELDIMDYSYDVLQSYKNFLSIWNDILNKRGSRLLSKQINLFTTNIDTFVEIAAEQTKVEFNDGFKGSINPIYDEGNFQKSYSKTSTHFQNTSEIPVFNLLKMHGSINWIESDKHLTNDYNLNKVRTTNEVLKKIDANFFIDIIDDWDELFKKAEEKSEDLKGSRLGSKYKNFFESYDKIIMVNPTKVKFSKTVVDIHFYELMRMYSNSLEKENSILFAMGFSFADEHIAKITVRSANINPTLVVLIFAFSEDDEKKILKNLTLDSNIINNNILILTPEKFINDNNNSDEISIKKLVSKIKNFDLNTANNVFHTISKMIPVSYNYGK